MMIRKRKTLPGVRFRELSIPTCNYLQNVPVHELWHRTVVKETWRDQDFWLDTILRRFVGARTQ